MEGLNSEIFGDKKFKDLLEEIYTNQKKKEKQISTLINELKPMVSDIGDATLIVPLIKEYLEIGVKNDEQLIKWLPLFNDVYLHLKLTVKEDTPFLKKKNLNCCLK
jgi:hypothetical protein